MFDGKLLGVLDGTNVGITEGFWLGTMVGKLLDGTEEEGTDDEGIEDGKLLDGTEEEGTDDEGIEVGKLLDGTEEEGTAVGAYCEQTKEEPLPDMVSYVQVHVVGAGLLSSPSAVDALYEGQFTHSTPSQYLFSVQGSTIFMKRK